MLTLLIVCATTDDEREYKLSELLIAKPAHIEMFKKRQMKPSEKMFFFDLPDNEKKMRGIAKMMKDGSKNILDYFPEK